MQGKYRYLMTIALSAFLLPTFALANDIQRFTIVLNTDVAAAGVGGLRNTPGPQSIVLTGVTGTVKKAFLYWHGPTNSTNPTANAVISFAGQNFTGTNIGFSSDNCWSFTNSHAYRADVTSKVTGNGTYAFNGYQTSTVNTNGASLIVFFDDGNPANNRDVVVFDGNDSNIDNPFDAPGWNVTLGGINYTAGTAFLQMHVSDGQTFPDDALVLNAKTLVAAGNVFQGTSVPGPNNGPSNDGNLWDIKTYDITTFLSPGPNNLSLKTGVHTDCLSLVVALVNLPAGSAPSVLCEVTLNKTTFVNGDKVTAQTLRFANPGTVETPVELKLWFEVPGLAPISFANVGADGSVKLPPGFDQTLGPIDLFTVASTFPRGAYAFNCRMLHPVTGKLLAEDINPFTVGPVTPLEVHNTSTSIRGSGGGLLP